MSRLARLLNKKSLNVIGIMSGTSLDGLDIALCRITPFGQNYKIKVLATSYAAYPVRLHKDLLRIVSADRIAKDELTAFEADLCSFYNKQIMSFISANKVGKVDLIGSHGQTIFHLDKRFAKGRKRYGLTWQLGDGDKIASQTWIPVISDFRRKDAALGGSGAPLTPVCHYHLFGSKKENRAILNIGGITNLTYLPKTGGKGAIRASDCGPGNMLVDQLMQGFYKRRYDSAGRKALAGRFSDALLKKMTSQSWFKKPFPKSLGREQFGREMVQRIVHNGNKLRLSKADIIATVSELTLLAVTGYLSNFPLPSRLIVAGGGVHNDYFMKRLSEMLSGCEVMDSGAMGIDPDYLEAVSFALLAAMFIKNDTASLPHVTGAGRPGVLGKLSLP
jgi:anhydro-N-acetylmuramic acid kinase